jgi:hypothetical protein
MNENLDIDIYSKKIIEELEQYKVIKNLKQYYISKFSKNFKMLNEHIKNESRDEYNQEMNLILESLKISIPYDHGELFLGVFGIPLLLINLFRQDFFIWIVGIVGTLYFLWMLFTRDAASNYNEKIDFISLDPSRFVKFKISIEGRKKELRKLIEKEIITEDIYEAIIEIFHRKLEKLEEDRMNYYQDENEKYEYNRKYSEIINDFIYKKL